MTTIIITLSKLRTMTMIYYRTVMFTGTLSVQQLQIPLLSPGTPSTGTLCPAFPLEWLDERISPTAVGEAPSPALSTGSRKGKGVKCKGSQANLKGRSEI